MKLGIAIFFSYAILAYNTRAIAKAQYLGIVISSAIWMGINFMLTRFIVEAKTLDEFLWYLVGGLAGEVLGVYLSKRFEWQT